MEEQDYIDFNEKIESLQKELEAVKAMNKKLYRQIGDFLSYFDPRGGISDVPLGPFERAQELLKGGE